MKISFASGKGGTGKTMFSTAISKLLNEKGKKVVLLDTDVDCPNSALFFNNKKLINSHNFYITIPTINFNKCNNCLKCVENCNYNALYKSFKGDIEIIKELCKSCGKCKYICPFDAIEWELDNIGIINHYIFDKMLIINGELSPGDKRGKAFVSGLKEKISDIKYEILIIDCPPGTSCSMVEAVTDSDLSILVIENTPFGFNDFLLAKSVLEKLNIKYKIIINKYDDNYKEIDEYCKKNNLPLIAKVKFSEIIANKNSKCEDLLEIDWFREDIEKICEYILEEIKNV